MRNKRHSLQPSQSSYIMTSNGADKATPLGPSGPLGIRIRQQTVRPEATKALPTFYRNIEEALDVRRAAQNFYLITQNSWQRYDHVVDFCSGDILGMAASPERRAEFLAEQAAHPDFSLGSTGVRLMDGNYPYLEEAEAQIAAFHGAETGLLVGSAFEANIAVWTAIPRPGDVILYDSLVHASTLEGIKQSLAIQKVEFPHSDIHAFRLALQDTLSTQPLIQQGKRCVLVALESIYSMDGDVCPLEELITVAKEVFHGMEGNVQFVLDEAHSIGVIGPQGAGLVCELALQDEVAVVVHSYGKAMGATGAVILGNKTVKSALVNFGRSIIYTTSPSFLFVAAIKSAYTLLKHDAMSKAQEDIQDLATLFFDSLASHPAWEKAQEDGLLSVPLVDGWEERPFLTHIITISTGTHERYLWWLYFALLSSGVCTFPVTYPVVPLGKGRLRVILHASNTRDQVKQLVDAVFAWVEEIREIEARNTIESVSKAAREFYAWIKQEGLSGYGSID
ncbi:hypothetical protein KVR01_012701 [Diaporthe batatas]|uniref:uncharacterized protein n=1 Tax=Diaporthe batatas TaxID=748121 RepID=UPI001D040946|nr:uncharacterized protein KVR01_012701 [Diaporthe batatas]KAG8157317.1 hypothetical protein KVR01_012701 [Diaporthe batatas]